MIERSRLRSVIGDHSRGNYRGTSCQAFGGWKARGSIPLTLGSFWAFIPVAVATSTIIVRTVLEDRMLQNELEGYKDYTRRVPHRLIPGVW